MDAIIILYKSITETALSPGTQSTGGHSDAKYSKNSNTPAWVIFSFMAYITMPIKKDTHASRTVPLKAGHIQKEQFCHNKF